MWRIHEKQSTTNEHLITLGTCYKAAILIYSEVLKAVKIMESSEVGQKTTLPALSPMLPELAVQEISAKDPGAKIADPSILGLAKLSEVDMNILIVRVKQIVQATFEFLNSVKKT